MFYRTALAHWLDSKSAIWIAPSASLSSLAKYTPFTNNLIFPQTVYRNDEHIYGRVSMIRQIEECGKYRIIYGSIYIRK